MLESEYGYIKDEVDWAHYCARIDDCGQPFITPGFDREERPKKQPYYYTHDGEPLEYPCLVQSTFGDDPNGPYFYSHNFVYLADAARLVYMSIFDLMEERDRDKKLYNELLEKQNETTNTTAY